MRRAGMSGPLALTLICVGWGQLPAQARAGSGLEAPLTVWPGEWKGSGWSINAAGERVEFTLIETVEPKAGGTVLLIQGRGVRTDSPGAGRVTHDGLALVYRDSAGRYRWNGHQAATGVVEAEVSLLGDSLRWTTLAGPAGPRIRFTISLDSTRWRESGEVSTEAGWTRFMEVTLNRVPR